MPTTLIGSSPGMVRVRQLIGPAAASGAPVFLTGESGTGKDLVAMAVHERSARTTRPFVTLNVSALPDDILDRELFGHPGNGAPSPYPSVPRYLAAAQTGTLYIDDICRASPAVQSRLLHLLRSGLIVTPGGEVAAFTARLVTASNTDLAECLKAGRLRRDLYDSLAVLAIYLPPLRERGRDAAEIAEAVYPGLLARFGQPMTPLPSTLLARLTGLPWPGNVRQLMNVLRRMALSAASTEGRVPDLPADVLTGPERGISPEGVPTVDLTGLTFSEIERQVVLDTIARHGGSVQRAADELDLAPSTIYRKLKSWGRG